MRIAILTALLILLALVVCAGEDTGYRVKAVVVNAAEQHMEAKFIVTPQDLRIVCKGDTSGISVGDYVKVELKTDHFIAGKMTCTEIRWYH